VCRGSNHLLVNDGSDQLDRGLDVAIDIILFHPLLTDGVLIVFVMIISILGRPSLRSVERAYIAYRSRRWRTSVAGSPQRG
jgi:hypothetical protein